MLNQADIIMIISYIGAGISIGLGAIGTAMGVGVIGGYGLQGISENPKLEGKLLRTMLIGMAIASTTAIYALVVAMLLIFVVTQGSL